MSEEAYRHHMTQVSAPMTKDLMVKYGVKRWTMVSCFPFPLSPHTSFVISLFLSFPVSPLFLAYQEGEASRGNEKSATGLILISPKIHNTSSTRALMNQLYDTQMARLADFDCFSQVVFRSVEDYKRMKEDPWYKQHLAKDHEHFADTRRSCMTIGWITEFVRDGEVVDGMREC